MTWGPRATNLHPQQGIKSVSQLDIRALETNFEGWRVGRAPDLSMSAAFERFCVELILRDSDLSDEEITFGLTGGEDDGGVDAAYFFVDRQLILEETKLPTSVSSASLWIIQAKNEKGFGENAILKMQSFMDDLLEFSKPTSSFSYYNQKVKDFFVLFRKSYEAIIGQPFTFSIHFVYATKSDQDANVKVIQREKNLRDAIRVHLSSAVVHVKYWGTKDLLVAARTPANRTLFFDTISTLMTPDGSVICLARLDKFAEFLTDENGNLRQYLLEPNVRDYQGEGNSVNQDIKKTLESPEVKEFWWLNNGITILADKCSIEAGKVKISSPELVNGLQTSHEVFNYFKSGKSDTRAILVRIILPPDEQTRRKIIKATNNQTQVSALSLHATEDIHFDIEELFKLYNLFYDRRKGEYRRLSKPISNIISIKELAQSVMAIVLHKPDDARARPMTVLGRPESYDQIFDVNVNRDLFLACILLDRQVVAYLASRPDLNRDERNDIRYYVDLWLAGVLAKSAKPNKNEIAGILAKVKNILSVDMLRQSTDAVYTVYKSHGGNDVAAKGSEMKDAMLAALETQKL